MRINGFFSIQNENIVDDSPFFFCLLPISLLRIKSNAMIFGYPARCSFIESGGGFIRNKFSVKRSVIHSIFYQVLRNQKIYNKSDFVFKNLFYQKKKKSNFSIIIIKIFEKEHWYSFPDYNVTYWWSSTQCWDCRLKNIAFLINIQHSRYIFYRSLPTVFKLVCF